MEKDVTSYGERRYVLWKKTLRPMEKDDTSYGERRYVLWRKTLRPMEKDDTSFCKEPFAFLYDVEVALRELRWTMKSLTDAELLHNPYAELTLKDNNKWPKCQI